MGRTTSPCRTGEPRVERLTQAGIPGSHGYRISPNSRWSFHTFSTFTEPPTTDLVSLPDHESQRIVVENDEVKKLLEETPRGESEFFRVNIGDGVELDGWMMKPPNFDPERQYPLVMYVYGEPAGQTVLNRWRGNNGLWHLLLTQHGYIVASVDNRGTPAPRGRAWRKSIYRRSAFWLRPTRRRPSAPSRPSAPTWRTAGLRAGAGAAAVR